MFWLQLLGIAESVRDKAAVTDVTGKSATQSAGQGRSAFFLILITNMLCASRVPDFES